VRRARADAFAASVLQIITSIKAEGVETRAGIATALNERGVRASRGGLWSPTQVQRVLKRLARDKSGHSRRSGPVLEKARITRTSVTGTAKL
jgi:hypothetical protein